MLYVTLDPVEEAGVLSVSFDGALETFYPLIEWPAPDQWPLEFEFLQQEGDPDARALLSLGGEPVLGLQGVEGRVMIDGMYWGMEGYCLPAAEATE